MALYRENPKCHKCGGVIKGIYKDQTDIPVSMRIIGDTFIRWDWQNHKCEEKLMQSVVINTVCIACSGSGEILGLDCDWCNGTGKKQTY